MKVFLVFLVCLFIAGCSGSGLLNSIPDHEFRKFTYDRTGNFSSAHIEAINASRTENEMTIDEITAVGDYGPIMSVKFHIEGYKRDVTNE